MRRSQNNKNIEQNKIINFYFDGKKYQGYQGDTLASALLANNIHLVGRSFKYNRPRGIVIDGSEEKNGIVQAGVGKASFGVEKICENINLFIDTIKKAKPSGSKGTYVKRISISSTMGVSLNCEIA